MNFLGLLTKALKPIFFILVARLYGQSLFALYYISWWSVGELLSRLAIFGLQEGLIREVASYDETPDPEHEERLYHSIATALLCTTLLSAILCSGLFFLAPWIASSFFKKPELILPLQWSSMGIFLQSFIVIFLAALRGKRIMRYEVYVRSLLESIALIGFCLLFFWTLPHSVEAIMAAQVGSFVVGFGAAWIFLTRHFDYRRILSAFRNLTLNRRMISFSIPQGFFELSNFGVLQLDTLMLAFFIPQEMVAAYGIASQIAFHLRKIRMSFTQIYAPIVARLEFDGEIQKLSRTYTHVARWSLEINLAILGGLWFFKEPLLRLFGEGFTVAASVLMVLGFGQFINGVVGISGNVLLMSGYSGINLFNSLLVAILNVLLNLVLIPRFGMMGAAAATTLSVCAVSFLSYWQLKRLMKVFFIWREFTRPALWGGVAFGSGLVSLWLLSFETFKRGTLWSGLVFLGVYGLFFWKGGFLKHHLSSESPIQEAS